MLFSLLKILYFFIVWLDLIFFTAILYILSFLPKKRTRTWYPILFQYWCKIFVRALGIDLKVHQKYLGKLPKSYILVANHPSAAEDVCMPALFNAKFLAKIEVKDWWIVGRIGKAAGTLYVKREDKASRLDASEALLNALKQGHSIGMYPEGGCKGRRIFTPFRYGAFELSINSGVPILPVFIYYEAQEAFEWQNQHLLHKLWMIVRAKNPTAHYFIFDLIYPDQFEDKKAMCDYVQNLYLQWQEKYLT
jgi:1-acyl-sn-glycerol-3-phosphate acyltransferase